MKRVNRPSARINSRSSLSTFEALRATARDLLLLVCVWSLAVACPVQARGASATREERATPAGEVLVVLYEGFLNTLVEAIASQPEPPTFPLSRGAGSSGEGKRCQNIIVLLSEASGTRTGVRFENGRITAPVAFRGSYQAPLVGCINFVGWASTVFNLAFDGERQALNARIEVRAVHLKNVPSLMSDGITKLVQDAIDERVNPVEILRADQLSTPIPVGRSSNLRLRAREVQHEVSGKELRLRIIYDITRNE